MCWTPPPSPRWARWRRNTSLCCYYRLLRVDEATARDLETVAQAARRLGRPPERREVPIPVRRRLQASCGSWSNALYQLGLEPRRPG